jgi:DNA (cytosine-5)-methyltransferase 1
VTKKADSLSTLGLFAGIGGIEAGLHKAGHRVELLCELDPSARAVLTNRFTCEIVPDIRSFNSFPKVDLIAAGFPCQDLSQAGMTAGIQGHQSRLVEEVFKRVPANKAAPKWLLFENVPFMLQLHRGSGMRFLVDSLEELGFTWAYRIVNAQSFGNPQRRRRVIMLASRTEDPRGPLFGADAGESVHKFDDQLCGFYWTEGLRGLGWAIDAVPTLKGGSTIGIPSPPAIWDPKDGSLGTPDIRDAERLQGFRAGWTDAATDAPGVRESHRWKLVGNAVSVDVAEWIGDRLARPDGDIPAGHLLERGVSWPKAAWGHKRKVYGVDVSAFPRRSKHRSLREFLRFPLRPLSHRAASGFLSRALVGGLRFEEGFIRDVRKYVQKTGARVA